EALVLGGRAREVAGRLGDLRLRIVATSLLEQAHYYRGDYERVVELSTDNFAALSGDLVHESFGMHVLPSVFDRVVLIRSLAHLGRFAEAATHAAQALRIAEPTQHANSVGFACMAASELYLLQGDWVKGRSLIERGIAVIRTGNVSYLLGPAIA